MQSIDRTVVIERKYLISPRSLQRLSYVFKFNFRKKKSKLNGLSIPRLMIVKTFAVNPNVGILISK